MMRSSAMTAIDLFSGCGGLSEGLKQARFNVVAGIEIDRKAAAAYRLNHPGTELMEEDIRKLNPDRLSEVLRGRTLHLLAGCPPCQGFSTIRKLNKKSAVRDARNSLILEYYRLVESLRPMAIMLENVPGIVGYTLFNSIVRKLANLGYHIDYKVVDVADYSVPQRRRRLVLVGSRLGEIQVAQGISERVTVREALEEISSIGGEDPLLNIYPRHSAWIQEMISKIPKDGGSRKELPRKYRLECHKRDNVGFSDVYGRLGWDTVSSTITGGCLNPSKGRFLHPEENRCISAREAALLQTFPATYQFPTGIPKQDLALMIGNALPPKFCRFQAENIHEHLRSYL